MNILKLLVVVSVVSFCVTLLVRATNQALSSLEESYDFEFPQPTGTYAVGIRSLHLVDKSRMDHIQNKAGCFRELMIQLFYPTDEVLDNTSKNYLPAYLFDTQKKDLSDIPGIQESDLGEFDLIKINSIKDAQISKAEKKYPLVVLSHGLRCSRFDYTALCEELASQGYVVAAIDHTYICSKTQFSDGRIVEFKPAFDVNAISNDTYPLIEKGVDRCVLDVRFVIDSLLTSEQYLDSENIAVVGHSFGGAVAMQTSLQDNRIKTAILMDPAFCGRLVPDNKTIPFMYLLAEQTDYDAILENTTLSNQKKSELRNVLNCYQKYCQSNVVLNANHMIFSNAALLKHMNIMEKLSTLGKNTDLGAGQLDGFKATQAIRDYSVAFLNKHLKGLESPFLQEDNKHFESFVELKRNI